MLGFTSVNQIKMHDTTLLRYIFMIAINTPISIYYTSKSERLDDIFISRNYQPNVTVLVVRKIKLIDSLSE
jgi:hypothetical protein